MAPRRRNPVNRRLRLLLMFLIAGFAVLLGRAAWLQGVQAGSLSSLAAKQHRAKVVLPASRGTIFDRTGVQLAIGEQATTVYADPRQVRDPRAVAAAAGRTLGVDANALFDQLSNRKASFVYVARKADPARAAAPRKAEPRGPRLLSGGAPLLSAGLGCVTHPRLCRPRQPRALRARAEARQDARRSLGRGDPDYRRARSRPRRRARASGGRRAERPPDARPHDPGERGSGAAADDHEVAREGRDGRRARPAERRRARDGERAGIRREQLRLDTARP